MGWQGGRELFQFIAASLGESLAPDDRIEIVTNAGQGWLRPVKQVLSDVLRGRARGERPDVRGLIGPGVLVDCSDPRDFDVMGPFVRAPVGLAMPWVGYIPDVQHRRLPDMFSPRERAGRDRNFAALLARARVVVVNAATVAEDLRHFYAPFAAEIVALPFAACPEEQWFEPDGGGAERYGLRQPYFLCSNQFWKHKNHGLVLDAIALARSQGAPIRFAFTGHQSDYRHPEYFAGLLAAIERTGIADDVHMLGFIPKEDQLKLMRRAAAVVQPSLSEGGPGGGAIYNAVALGRPAILSDLPVNREIGDLATAYFDPRDPADLLRALREILANRPAQRDPATLLAEGRKRRRAFGDALYKAFSKAPPSLTRSA